MDSSSNSKSLPSDSALFQAAAVVEYGAWAAALCQAARVEKCLVPRAEASRSWAVVEPSGDSPLCGVAMTLLWLSLRCSTRRIIGTLSYLHCRSKARRWALRHRRFAFTCSWLGRMASSVNERAFKRESERESKRKSACVCCRSEWCSSGARATLTIHAP